jgi:hypothetical protein
MSIIIKSMGKGKLAIYDSDDKAKIGRWCKAPLIPDRCDRCFDPETLAHYEAEGYREEMSPDGTIWRYGTCHRCQEQDF